MKITHVFKEPEPNFRPVTITIQVDSLAELKMLLALSQCNVTVPETVAKSVYVTNLPASTCIKLGNFLTELNTTITNAFTTRRQ